MRTLEYFRILALMSALSYMIVILSTWIYASYQGYTYFKAGEPCIIVKHLEWVLGIAGIITLIDIIKEKITLIDKRVQEER